MKIDFLKILYVSKASMRNLFNENFILENETDLDYFFYNYSRYMTMGEMTKRVKWSMNCRNCPK